MRRAIVLALTVGLLVGVVAGPVEAKKKKKPAPVTFQAEGSLLTANPSDVWAWWATQNGTSVTRQEFLARCAVPENTQGFDGFVVELDKKISKVDAEVGVTGSDLIGYDLDMYFFDESCAPVGEAWSDVADEVGVMPAGTQYVLVIAFSGAEITFELKATELK